MISSEFIDKDAADHVSGLYFSRQVEFQKRLLLAGCHNFGRGF
jgi:hypothetical protein